VAGFRRAITRVFQQYGKKFGLFEKSKVEVEGDDFREGLSAIISVKVPEPQFEGQTKTKLGNSEVIGIVDVTVSRTLEAYLEENPRDAKNIISKVILAAQARAAARKARELVQRKTFCLEADFQENSLTALSVTQKKVNCSWLRVTQQEEQPNKAATETFRPFCHSGVRSSTLKRPWNTGSTIMKRSETCSLPLA
jgi:DNA gyrase/topoisomerase IV subunit B